jgi:hypothetical protein
MRATFTARCFLVRHRGDARHDVLRHTPVGVVRQLDEPEPLGETS